MYAQMDLYGAMRWMLAAVPSDIFDKRLGSKYARCVFWVVAARLFDFIYASHAWPCPMMRLCTWLLLLLDRV